MIELINHAAEMLGMPDPTAAFHHSRIAIIDYAQAYRGHHSPDRLLESAYLHLEKAVSLGGDRERIDAHFYRIRQRRFPVSD
jgi:hypothetical protein